MITEATDYHSHNTHRLDEDEMKEMMLSLHEVQSELKEFGITPLVYDPLADAQEVKHEYGIDLVKKEDLPQADTLIVAVAHKEFTQMKETDLKVMMNHDNLLVVDIKHLYNKKLIEDLGMTYWSL